jgi:hypothetical protein
MEFNSLITNLITNIENNKNDNHIIPKEIDLILDGGAFNGCFELGILLYIKQMESTNRISIKRISGTSVGSILGLLYLLDKLDFAIVSSFKLWENYKSHMNLNNFKLLVYEITNNIDKDTYKKLNKKLYVTYYNYKTKIKIIKYKYKSNNDVAESIIKSAFVPYLMNGNFSYNNYVDGISPYIFKPKVKRKILFVYLASTNILKLMCTIKNEKNANGRILSGIIDINHFFTSGKSNLCSYMNDWNMIDIICLKLRDLVWISLLFLYDIMNHLYKSMPEFIKKNNIVKIINKIFIDIFKQKMMYCLCI